MSFHFAMWLKISNEITSCKILTLGLRVTFCIKSEGAWLNFPNLLINKSEFNFKTFYAWVHFKAASMCLIYVPSCAVLLCFVFVFTFEFSPWIFPISYSPLAAYSQEDMAYILYISLNFFTGIAKKFLGGRGPSLPTNFFLNKDSWFHFFQFNFF